MTEAAKHTFEELNEMTVAQLRDTAKEHDHEALKGYSTMRKEVLLGALCEALGIETQARNEAAGGGKAALKSKIKALKVDRAQALEAGDPKGLKRIRRRIRRLKRKIRSATA